jgi:PAS domain S-box-containing protein
LAGLIISLLISALLATSYKTADEARALAREMTAELRLSEQEAREMLLEIEQQRLAFDHHAIVAVTDTAGTINFVNEKFCAISGYEQKALIGFNHRMLNSGVHPKAFFEAMYHAIESGRVWSADICNRANKGDLYWVHTTVVPFMNSQGKPVKYVSISTDITALKQAEAQLEKQRDRLQMMVDEQTADLRIQRDRAEAANVAKTEFIANMSHELRTPMHGILSLSDLGLKRGGQLPPEKLLQYFAGINDSGKRLMRLVEDVMALSVVDVEAGKLDLRAANMLHLVEHSLAGYQPAADEKKQTLQVHSPACPVMVLADRTRISQVIGHLLNNAIKYSPPASLIEIDFAPASLVNGAPALQVSVRDHGVGIPEGELEAVFESFTQSTRTKTGAGGTGLGLAICRRIVRVHGGEIHAELTPNGGSTLRFTLPLVV